MRLALATIYDSNYKELAAITVHDNKEKYCQRRGYHLICHNKDFVINNVGFEKIRIVLKALNSGLYDAVFWLGCDTLVTNFRIGAEDVMDPNYGMIIASDSNWPINADSFIVRNTPSAISFIQEIFNSMETYISNEYFEQSAIVDLLATKRFEKVVKIVPQRVINSYNYFMYPHIPKMASAKDYYGNDGSWQKGDFVIHWPGVTLENRIILARNYVKEVIDVSP